LVHEAGAKMSALAVPAPAKLNLFLHVTGRRADGYHELETLFQLLDVGDELLIEATRAPGIVRARDLAGVPEAQDLTLRAARLLAEHCGVRRGARLTVHKRIPMGGGLGGGSSDAASVLVALDRLWGLQLGVEVLARLGLRLGADVPLFVRGRSAFASGVGEVLRPVALAPQWYLVLCPPVQVSTARVFAAPSLTRDTPPLKIRGFPWDLDGQAGLERVWQRTRNDCEAVVRAFEPGVARLLDWLASRAPARMSGTGACVFARFTQHEAAEHALAAVPAGVKGFVAAGVDRSPLLDAMQRKMPG
jgi:4-diphosphocytidyl-2-C-methyl-D-erythritol kinase